jgi:hypothetical protein
VTAGQGAHHLLQLLGLDHVGDAIEATGDTEVRLHLRRAAARLRAIAENEVSEKVSEISFQKHETSAGQIAPACLVARARK